MMGRKEKSSPAAGRAAANQSGSSGAAELDVEHIDIRPTKRVGRPPKAAKDPLSPHKSIDLPDTNPSDVPDANESVAATTSTPLVNSPETYTPIFEINQRPRRQIKHKYIKSTSYYPTTVETPKKDPPLVIEPIPFAPTCLSTASASTAADPILSKPVRRRGRPRKERYVSPTIILEDNSNPCDPSVIMVDLIEPTEVTEEVVETCTIADETEHYELMVVEDMSQPEVEPEVVCINDDSTSDSVIVVDQGQIVVRQGTDDTYLVTVEDDSQLPNDSCTEVDNIYVEVIESVDDDSVVADDVSQDNISQTSTIIGGEGELTYGFVGEQPATEHSSPRKSEITPTPYVGAFSGIRKPKRYEENSTDSDGVPDTSPDAVQIAVKQLTMLGVTCISSTPKLTKKDGETSLSLGRQNGVATSKQLASTLRRVTRKNSILCKPKKLLEKKKLKTRASKIVSNELESSESNSGSIKSLELEDSPELNLSKSCEMNQSLNDSVPIDTPAENTKLKTYPNQKKGTLKDRMRNNMHDLFKKSPSVQNCLSPASNIAVSITDSSASTIASPITKLPTDSTPVTVAHQSPGNSQVAKPTVHEVVPEPIEAVAVDAVKTSDDVAFAAQLGLTLTAPIQNQATVADDTDDILNNITHKKYRRKTSLTPMISSTESNPSSPQKNVITTNSSNALSLNEPRDNQTETPTENVVTSNVHVTSNQDESFVAPSTPTPVTHASESKTKPRSKPEKTSNKVNRKSSSEKSSSSGKSRHSHDTKDSHGKSTHRKSSSKPSTNSVQSASTDSSSSSGEPNKHVSKSDSKPKIKDSKHNKTDVSERKIHDTENGKISSDSSVEVTKESGSKRPTDSDKKKKTTYTESTTKRNRSSDTSKRVEKKVDTYSILSDCYLPKMVKHDASLYSIEAMRAAEAKRVQESKELADAKRAIEQKKLDELAAKLATDKAVTEALYMVEIARKIEIPAVKNHLPEMPTTQNPVQSKGMLKFFDPTQPPPVDVKSEHAFETTDTKPDTTETKLDANETTSDANETKPIVDDVDPKIEIEVTKTDSVVVVAEPNEEETNIRRSGRIKVILETKQRSQGFGLVRDRERFQGMLSSGESSLNSSQDIPDTDCNSLGTQSSTSDLDLSQKSEPVRKTKEMVEKEQRDLKEGLSLFKQITDNEFKSERFISKSTKRMECDCFLTQSEIDRGEFGCGEDCLNRLLMIECGSRCAVGSRCTNKRFQKHQNSDCTIFKTDKKGFGLLANSFIAAGEFIMEYVGEVLNSQQFEQRAFDYSKDQNKHYYFMALRSDCVIDATSRGNISRFINHSCDPNAETQKWTVNGELRIGFFSTKDIYPDQEITFDYQFQRYGKEAQRCYCEAECCRGWIGEEPDSDDELVEEELDNKTDSSCKPNKKMDEVVPKPICSSLLPTPDNGLLTAIEPAISDVESVDPLQPLKEKLKLKDPKLKKHIKQKRAEIMEDPDLDQDIAMLTKSNLKNQTQTLRFSRLMVRAKLRKAKSQLLSILRCGELACRRLFLDYHGLKLLYTWMCDAVSTDMRVEWEFRLEILETLEVLPIPNKLMLQESKVLATVQKWAGLASESSAKSSPDETTSPPSDGGTAQAECDIPKLIEQNSIIKDIELDALKQIIVTSESNEKKNIELANAEPMPPVPASASIKPICDYPELLEEIHQIANKLVTQWDVLPEVFRIPKKIRIEQMKEHEREANRNYRALGLSDENTAQASSKNSERFRERDKDPEKERLQKEREARYRQPRNDFLNPNDVQLSKYHRRKQFEAKVEADKEKEMRHKVHTSKCTFFRLDPRSVAEQDVPFFVDPFSSQWFGSYGQPVPTPPSHIHIKPLPKKQSTNPDDYNLPAMDLPEYWTYAIDPSGRLYYYHIKIRIPQWEIPIKLLPLSDQPEASVTSGQTNGHANLDGQSDSDGSSDTDAESSSEDELQNKLTQLKTVIREKKQGLKSMFVQPPNLAEEISAMASTSDGTTTSFKSDLAIQIESIIPQRRRKCRKNLVQEHVISPRTEEERMELRIEMRRYKENKLQAKRRRQLTSQDPGENPRKMSKLTQGLPAISDNADFDFSMEMEERLSSHMNDEPLSSTGLNDDTAQNSPTLSNLVFRNRCVDELDLSQKPLRDHIRQQAAAERSLKRKRSTTGEPISDDSAKRIKHKFQRDIIGLISNYLSYYRRDTCTIGRITNDEDFSHLTRKLSHFVMLKELKHCDNTVNVLEVTDSVKVKAKDYIRKYMVKFGSVYVRSTNDPSYNDVPDLI